MMKNLKHTIKSIYLCMKYPFLYPRNVFSGHHYTNWKLNEYMRKIYNIAYIDLFFFLDFPDPDGSRTRHIKNIRSYWYLIYYYILKGVNEIIQLFHCIPTYTYYDWIPDGWEKAFGLQYMDELKKQLKKDKILYKWRIYDVKEKYGTLRVYCNYGTDAIYKIIDKYEDLSYETCYYCGKPVYKVSEGYILPYCKDCWEKEFGPDDENNNEKDC